MSSITAIVIMAVTFMVCITVSEFAPKDNQCTPPPVKQQRVETRLFA